jgi:hypothetical protein
MAVWQASNYCLKRHSNRDLLGCDLELAGNKPRVF